ncbi:sigma-70 region 4 domain-containing protein [Halobacteria archaeon HArc-gm2]|nr:sigma-70 region 4 domain-containing protein [Halobacteria archaeon HArc-gm2]
MQQVQITEFEPDLSALSDAQREVYQAVERDGYGVREYARKTGRAPGTVGNLLRRARNRLGGEAS